MRVEIGVLAPTREELIFGDGDPAAVVSFCEEAESVGVDSVWVGESLLARPRFDPLLLLAAIAVRTTKIRIGTAVLLPALHHPVSLAHETATLDRLAGGRLLLGIGAGAPVPGTEEELAATGVAMSDRVGRLLEGMDLVKRLWRGPVDRWESSRWPLNKVDLEVRPRTPGGPPVWLGGDAPATLERAGQRFDGWIPFVADPRRYTDGLARIRRVAASAGRCPDEIVPALYLNLCIDDNPEAARSEQRTHLERYYGVPSEFTTALQASHAGTFESARGYVRSFVDAGARHLVIRLTTTRPIAQLSAVAELAELLRRDLVDRRQDMTNTGDIDDSR